MMRKSISVLAALSLAFGGLMLAPAPATAQTGADNASLAEQLTDLLAQIRTLQARIMELQQQQGDAFSELREAVQLTRSLARGMSGEDVTELQELLASDPELYPEGLVTGFFGPLTERAVERLQRRFGIDEIGAVGPNTVRMLNRLFRLGNRGHGNVFDRVIFDPEDDDDVDASQFTPGMVGIKLCHVPGGAAAAMHTIAVGGPAVQAHLAHGDTLGECDDDADDSDDADEDEDENEDEDEDEDDENEDMEEAQEAIDEAQSAIDAAQVEIDAVDEDGHDVTEAEELLEDAEDKLAEAQEAFDDEDWETAEELAEEAEDLADDAREMAEDLADEDEDDE